MSGKETQPWSGQQGILKNYSCFSESKIIMKWDMGNMWNKGTLGVKYELNPITWTFRKLIWVFSMTFLVEADFFFFWGW